MQVTKFPVAPGLPRRTFTMTAQHIRRQKQRIDDLTGSSATTPSTFVTVAALAWVSFVRSKHPIVISIDHDVYLSFFVDCRGRRCGGIDPPISEDYFGTSSRRTTVSLRPRRRYRKRSGERGKILSRYGTGWPTCGRCLVTGR